MLGQTLDKSLASVDPLSLGTVKNIQRCDPEPVRHPFKCHRCFIVMLYLQYSVLPKPVINPKEASLLLLFYCLQSLHLTSC